MSKQVIGGAVLVVALTSGIGYVGYSAGQHTGTKIRYYSEMMEKTQGTKRYLIDGSVVCSNGKDLGKFQVDMDLTNGKLRVVRLDNKLTPDCYLDHPIAPQYPQGPGPGAAPAPPPPQAPPTPPVKK